MSSVSSKVLTVSASLALVVGVSAFAGSEASTTPRASGVAHADRSPNPLGAAEWMYVQRLNPDGTMPYAAIDEATSLSEQMSEQRLAATDGTAAKKWRLTGPSNIGGRVTMAAADPTQKKTVYIAAATGGIWKSTDYGSTYTSVWKSSYPQSMGAVAVDENGVVWAGTGEPDNGGGSAYYGNGVYKSTDGGATWTNMGLKSSGGIGQIAIDPTDPDRVFVAAQGRLHDLTGNRGLFLTTDGGDSWKQVLEGESDSVGAIDVAIDPNNPDIVLCTTWDKIRDEEGRIYGKGSKLYRSTDGGLTWKDRQKPPLPQSYDDPDQPVTQTYVGRMGIAFAPTEDGRAYLISSTAGGNFNGFFTSTDSGDNWTAVGATSGGILQQISGGFAWWFGRVWVDPSNESHVFLAGVALAESQDGGQTWNTSASVHADQHALAWDPFVKDRVYLGNDGGFYRSDTNGAVRGLWTKTPLLPTTQFYAIDSSLQHPDWINGGSQDNNSLKSWQSDGSVTGSWVPYVGGDGMMNRIDPTDDRYYYGCSQNGGCVAVTPSGQRNIPIPGARKNWVAPLEFRESDPKWLYGGSERVNRINIDGGGWQAISDDLTGGPTPRGAGFGTVTAIGSGFERPGLVYAGTDDGRLWRSKNADAANPADVKWKRLKGKPLPKTWVTRVSVSPKTDKWAAASFSGWRKGSYSPHVLVTKNLGKSWIDISGNLPQAPVNDVIWSPTKKKGLYVATDVGVFRTRDLGETWIKIGANLPLVPINDIDLNPTSMTLYAATYGRSVWQTKAKY